MSERYVGRQPIIDMRAKIAAYDLLYRESGHDDPNRITASVISNLLNATGMEAILGKHFGFLRINGDFLGYEIIHSLPQEKIVYALLADTPIDEVLLERLRRLKEEGYRFALNDCIYTAESAERYAPLFPLLDYLKIDVSQSDLKALKTDREKISNLGITLIATKIETHDVYDLCRSMGFGYFQGYFISQPNVIRHAAFSPEQESILQLWNLLQSDVEMPMLVDAFHRNHLLSMKLLQFINSAAFSLRTPVASIEHVLTLMGRDPISRWIMLMLFAEAGGKPTVRVPLLLMVINRTELMSGLIERFKPSASKSEKASAYFVGMLSLIHLLFNMPHRDVLAKLNISQEIESALLKGEGFYGELLDLVRMIEVCDDESIAAFLTTKGLTYPDIEPILKQAMENVNKMEKELEL